LNETSRVHHAARRRSGGVVTRGAGAATSDAADRVPKELGRLGFVEGQNLRVVQDGFEVRHDQLTERATEIIKAAPDVIFTPGPAYTRAAQIATRPIVGGSADMVADGLVASLARPDGNTTGISMILPELDGKRQDILIEAVPGVYRIAALADPSMLLTNIRALQDTAQAHGVVLSVFSAGTPCGRQAPEKPGNPEAHAAFVSLRSTCEDR
jgi:putative tryptophan/tyrosine transport system substrate-binding protein